VLFYHCTLLLHADLPHLAHVAIYGLPGVPVFFVVSGFLITGSLMRKPSTSRYVRARVLRIYPALWVCFGVSVLAALVAGVIDPSLLATGTALRWVVTQLSLARGMPAELSAFGTGDMNASLWTIAVELQFYVIALVVMRLRGNRSTLRMQRAAILTTGTLSLAVSILAPALIGPEHGTLNRALGASAAPYFWIFALGAAARLWWDVLRSHVRHPLLWLLLALLWENYVTSPLSDDALDTALQAPVRMLILAMMTLALAHSWPGVAWRLLRGNDISYGVYLYHFVVLNCFIEWGGRDARVGTPVVLVATTVLATLSWLIVERRALRWKDGWRRSRPAAPGVAPATELPRT
jgi:peptidoglycan/LPS O-acetylase OafA/YrhL